jgi:hypothetical protein
LEVGHASRDTAFPRKFQQYRSAAIPRFASGAQTPFKSRSGSLLLDDAWTGNRPARRLHSPLESISGLLLFGLSTAVMLAVMSRLIKNRLRYKPGDLDESELGQ